MSEKKERPILFSGPMVRAILEGRKTQTRRVIRNPGRLDGLMLAGEEPDWCPYGGKGDRLWVRETWQEFDRRETMLSVGYGFHPTGDVMEAGVGYRADIDECGQVPVAGVRRTPKGPWRPSIFMPRWASRITLEVEAVRVERLHDISEGDAKAEGVACAASDAVCHMGSRYRHGFRHGWDTINGKRGSWESNPRVWVVTFKRVEP